MGDKIEIGRLFCAGEYLGAVDRSALYFDTLLLRDTDGPRTVQGDPSLQYMTIWIVPRDGCEQDVLELLKQQVRDHLPMDYKLATEDKIHEIQGVLTSVVLDKDSGKIKMSLDLRKELIELLTERAQGTR